MNDIYIFAACRDVKNDLAAGATWFQTFPPYGRYPVGGTIKGAPADAEFVIDEASAKAVMDSFNALAKDANWPGILVDEEHYSLDREKSSAALAWAREIRQEPDGSLWTRLSVFGNPFPPFDWGSGMGVLDVSRREALELGLVDDAGIRERIQELRQRPLPDFNRDMQASVPNLRSDSLCGKILKREFGDQVVIENSVVHWQGNLIRDVLAGSINKARLGMTTPEALKKMSGKLPQEDIEAFKSMNPSFNRTTFRQHAAKHYGGNEKRLKTNIPLEEADYDLMPAVWHNPDTIYPGDDHGAIFEMQTFDGNYLQLAVNAIKGFASYYKTKNPLGAASGNSSFIP